MKVSWSFVNSKYSSHIIGKITTSKNGLILVIIKKKSVRPMSKKIRYSSKIFVSGLAFSMS